MMGVHINEGYHGNLIVEYVNERGVSHPFCTLLKNGDSYQVYINPRMPVMSVEEFFDAFHTIRGLVDYDDAVDVDITSPNFSSLTQKGIEHLEEQGITLVSTPSLRDKLEEEMLKHRESTVFDDKLPLSYAAKKAMSRLKELQGKWENDDESEEIEGFDSLDGIVDKNTLNKYRDVIEIHNVPFTKQQLIDLHDSLCYTRPDKYGAFPQEVESLITHLDYLIDNLP